MGVGRKEKYYNYVVSDMISKTVIEDGKVLDYPYSKLPEDAEPEPVDYFTSFKIPSLMFERYVTKIYGAKKEEWVKLWKLYKDIIKDKINNG
jgi:hypothetical protein|tara:strand:- start:857 stop:1132 length:276 start_codon:yes stop_codon:yes gene_type:complete